MPHRIRGFTLVELIVVIAILVMLLGLFFPAMNQIRDNDTRRPTCMNNQSQIALAFLNYENNHKHFPGWREKLPGGPEVSWPLALLPYLEEPVLYDRIVKRGKESLSDIAFPPLPLLLCKSSHVDRNSLRTNYVANCGKMDAAFDAVGPSNPVGYLVDENKKNGVLFDNVNTETRSTVDYISGHSGTSYTILLSESQQGGRYMEPVESAIGFCYPDLSFTGQDRSACSGTVVPVFINRCKTGKPEPIGKLGEYRLARPSSNHPQGIVATFCDRSVRPLSEKIDPDVFNNLMKTDCGVIITPETLY